MNDDEPGLADLGELERHRLAEIVQDGRAVDDPRLASAAVELARQQRRVSFWLMTSMLTVPALVAGLVQLVVTGTVDRTLVVAALVVMAPFALGFGWLDHANAAAAERANQALLDGARIDPEAAPSVGQRIGAGLLALLVAVFTARMFLWVGFAGLRAVGVEPGELPAWGQVVGSLVVMGPIWLLGYRAFTRRSPSS
ncbi:hypothetical protein [Egicoccus sp. AB-alg2]|uniref:hypothetical protein n=1 Tax=Egicoccus sp. AB-alg2 TaxID=3242693 RepID=UPI00359D6B14